ncbi:MAG TPA: sigma-70 family RNA polymerase sigma factor, partial [Thermoanaerobaculia bacterium]
MDEATLLRRLLRGDEEAFEIFVDEYYPRLYRFAWPRTGRDGDATQEIVQSTFQKAIPQLDRYRGEAALFSWLCSICRAEIFAWWNERDRKMPQLLEDSVEIRAALESLAKSAGPAEEELQQKELARLIRVALDSLPVHYGNALDWKYLQGWSTQKIADHLGLSP